jgi:hypothetical protein
MRPGDVGGGLGYVRGLRVDLASPLGQRVLTDASSGETREAFDRMRLLRPPPGRSHWSPVAEGGSRREWTTTYISGSFPEGAYMNLTIRDGTNAQLHPELDYDETGQVELRHGKSGVWGLESRSHHHLRLSWKEQSDIVDLSASRSVGLESVLAFAESLQRPQ